MKIPFIFRKEKTSSPLLFLSFGVVFGIAVFFLAAVIFLRSSLLQEQECAYDFEKTKEGFEQRIKKNPNWVCRQVQCGLPLQQKGARIAVFELCSRKYAGMLLNDPESRKTGSMIPCRIAIYEKNGKVYLSRLNLPLFYRLTGGNAAEVFTNHIIPEQEFFLHGLIRK